MVVALSTVLAPARGTRSTIDIAGIAWPVYKLEALALGLLIGLILLVITASAQTAVLVGATAVGVAWIAGARRTRPAR